MKSFILITAFILSTLAQAESSFNHDCKFAYREAIIQLLDSVETLNSYANRSEEIKSKAVKVFVADVATIDTGLKAQRAACYFTEDPANKSCVVDYKEMYQNVRDRINLIAMLSGNQANVDLSFLGTVALRGKVALKDVKCGY